ncbi:unnamed protein product [Paramecium sonneborni]|uniref:Transmembrane protein n=1 Tax=Paramecium sonneborni TaxID=65129 RepID=A0A8S1RTZ1_9CILI|nr:unnamed protein product [Paramecium sonneborni]
MIFKIVVPQKSLLSNQFLIYLMSTNTNRHLITLDMRKIMLKPILYCRKDIKIKGFVQIVSLHIVNDNAHPAFWGKICGLKVNFGKRSYSENPLQLQIGLLVEQKAFCIFQLIIFLQIILKFQRRNRRIRNELINKI